MAYKTAVQKEVVAIEMALKKWPVYFVGLASAFSDVATSWVCLQYPELVERNPLANPFLEAASVLGSQAAILHIGEKLKVNPKSTVALALLPAMVPFAAAANNIVHLAIVHAKDYPFEECPLLYPEK